MPEMKQSLSKTTVSSNNNADHSLYMELIISVDIRKTTLFHLWQVTTNDLTIQSQRQKCKQITIKLSNLQSEIWCNPLGTIWTCNNKILVTIKSEADNGQENRVINSYLLRFRAHHLKHEGI